MKLFIAIILQTFQQTSERDNKFMSTDISEHFKEVWSNFDPDATSFILVSQYKNFLLKLGEPLGWDVTFNHNFMKQQEYF
jgi:hypothetical protein